MKESINRRILTVILGIGLSLGVAVAQTCDIEAPAEDTSVNMIGWAFPITEFYADELEVCNEVDNLEINTQLLDSSGTREQVRLALSGGGESPFAILHGANGDVVEWASQDWVQPITDLVEKYSEQYNLDDIAATAWAGGTYEGEIYGVPIVANTHHIMYRMDLFEEYGLTPPETYDDVIAACEVLADEVSIDLPFTINLHAGWAWEIEFFHFLEAYGGTYLNDDNTPAFNSEAGVNAINKIVEVASACMGDEGLTFSVDDSEVGLSIGSLGFVNMWASRAASMDDPERSNFVDGIGFAPAPAPVAGGKLGGSAWNDFYMIPTTTDVDRELAFLIIMEAADAESQQRAAEVGIVTRASVAEGGFGGRYLEAASTTIIDGVGIYAANPAIPLVRTALGNVLPLVGNGDLTAEEALAQAAEDYTSEATAQGFIE
ncbi:MAG: extracellular solute-binding protein [Deinococcota bacterium]